MLTDIHPKLPMRNKNVTREFYVIKLGFTEFGSSDYDGYLMLQKDNIRTDHIDQFFQLIIANKTSIHPNGPLETKPWGQKEFSVLDPDNNLLTFGQNL